MRMEPNWLRDCLTVAAAATAFLATTAVRTIAGGVLISVGAAIWVLVHTPPETVFTVSAASLLHAAFEFLALCTGFAFVCYGAILGSTGWVPKVKVSRALQRRLDAALVRLAHRLHALNYKFPASSKASHIFFSGNPDDAAPDWRTQAVDEHILPLVRALNRPGIVWTLASCQGHHIRHEYPYVSFAAPLGVASRLSQRLSALNDAGSLNYKWRIAGRFNDGAEFSYVLESPDLSPRDTAFGAFWRFVVRRKLIDADLLLLAEEVTNVLDPLGDIPPLVVQKDQADCDEGECDHLVSPRPFRLLPKGISASTPIAPAAHLGIGRDGSVTNDAAGHIGHFDNSSGCSREATLTFPEKEQKGDSQ